MSRGGMGAQCCQEADDGDPVVIEDELEAAFEAGGTGAETAMPSERSARLASTLAQFARLSVADAKARGGVAQEGRGPIKLFATGGSSDSEEEDIEELEARVMNLRKDLHDAYRQLQVAKVDLKTPVWVELHASAIGSAAPSEEPGKKKKDEGL